MICQPVNEKKSVVSKRVVDLYFSLGSVKRRKEEKMHGSYTLLLQKTANCNM